MSIKGQLKRGKALYNFRNKDGVLPKVILKDSHKMEEINYYLDSIKAVKKTNSKEIKKEDK